ncbi:MAG: efflux RND transporter periplasmic adaptor subunit [Alphaproteobacteria bacterium]|nr:MAG: efflux RND transporter periplasmic adaptor subunit [Alphaproteobacteria bacterium]
MVRARLITAGILFTAILGRPLAAEPTGEALLSQAHDCLVQPFIVSELGSPANGLLEEMLVDRGQRITKGMVVAKLRSDLEQASFDLAKARAESTALIQLARERVSLLRKETSRNTELHNKQFAATALLDKSMSELQQAISQLTQAETDQALAVLEMRRAAVLLDQRSILSPIDGFVVRRLMAPGEHVYEQAKILKVAQIDPLFVEVNVPIAAFPFIKEGMKAEVRPSQPVGRVLAATVSVIDKVLDAASDTFGVRLVLPNPTMELPAGVNCTVTFPAAAK